MSSIYSKSESQKFIEDLYIECGTKLDVMQRSVCLLLAAVFSGLAIDIPRRLLYFSDEGQGQIRELKLKLNITPDVTISRTVDSTPHSRPRSLAVDTINR